MGRSGTGLGLTIVMTTVGEHGGTVKVDSTKDETSFFVYLPVSNESVERQEDILTIEDLHGNGTILVVDDEPMQRDIARKILQHLGYTVNSVQSGEEALDYLLRNQTDLLLLDMLMPPGKNGYQAFKEIVKKRPDQKAIIVSGFSEHEDVQKALDLGVGQFLKKPYSIRNLGKAVSDELAKN